VSLGGVVEDGEGILAVFGGGGDVASDVEAVFGDVELPEASGDPLLGLPGAQVAFGLVVGRGNPGVVGESKDVDEAFPEDPQEVVEPGFDRVEVPSGVADRGAVVGAEALGLGVGDRGESGGPREVVGVDECPEGVGDPVGPGGPGVALGGVGEVS
jgi:hypothetical protein